MSTKPLRVGIYGRISTADKGQDADLQLVPLREFCKVRGWTVVGEYVDIGISGAKDKRPQLDKLMDDARKRKLDCVVVWKLDRWGRSLKHLVVSVGELQSLKVGFVSYMENIDLTTPSGKLMLHVLGAMAEFERELIKERVRAGVENARKKGKHIGRKALPPIMADKINALRADGHSIRVIAKKLGLSSGVVHKVIQKTAS